MKTKKVASAKDRTFLIITIPIVALFFLFNTLPLITGAFYSFTNYRGYGDFDFVGFRNYIDLFTDSRVGHSYLFTFKYAIAGTILINVLSLLLAMGLNSKIRCKSLLRGMYFVPNILGGLIIGYIFSFIFTYIIPAVAKAMHIGFLENSILASEKHAWIGVLVVGVWQAVAMNTIIYISGLQTIPTDMTKGGPAQSTESISYLIYRNGMDGGQFGYQCANAVIFFIVIVAFSVIQLKMTNKKEEQL